MPGWAAIPEALYGSEGVVIWYGFHPRRPPEGTHLHPAHWEFVVEVDGIAPRWLVVHADSLEGTDEFSRLENHVASVPEVSFDVESGIEGCFRRPGQFWEVFFFNQLDDCLHFAHRSSVWKSGIVGHHFDVPDDVCITQAYVVGVLSRMTGLAGWRVIQAMDSCSLK